MNNLFFIHNYKTMGTTIIKQMPQAYQTKFYGHVNINDYQIKNNSNFPPNWRQILNMSNSHVNNVDQYISIDHLHIDTLLKLGILTDYDITNTKFIMLVREPIDRFISICNFEDIYPNDLIYKLQHNMGDNYYQHKIIKTQNNWDITTYKTTSFKLLTELFNQFNIVMDFSIKRNVSIKKYNRKQLSIDQLLFLKEFYKDDYELYNNSF